MPYAVAQYLMIVSAFPELAKLRSEQKKFQRSYYAPNSITTRDVQIKKYLDFIDDFDGAFAPMPCSSDQVALYATWLARNLKYTSIINYLSGLNYFLRQNDSQPIDYKDFVIQTTLKGIKRIKGDSPHQAAPILPSMLRAMFTWLKDTTGHTAWRAAVLCSFRALLRKSQVTFSDSVLNRGDFTFHKWGMIIRIHRSKTIQFSERTLDIPVANCPDTALCAVYWVKRHFWEMPARDSEPAFRIPDDSQPSVPLTYSIYQRMLKLFSEKAGLEPTELSSHSLSCTYLAMCGASLEELRVRGDWSSDSIFAYLRTPISMRIISDIRVATLLASDR